MELSYVDLEKDFQDIFLDVACFLKGSHKEEAIRILKICGLPGRIGLRDLELKSLIKFSSDQHLDMHDHIQGMGRYIVQRMYPDDPKKHSRLWEREKIEELLDNEWVSEETRAIALDECLTSDIVAKGFGNIKHLRFLRMISKRDENTHHVSRNFPSTLRYLSWEFYPDWSLPRKFQPNNLVALEMYGCKIKRLWEGEEKKVLKKLKFLVLSHSELTFLDL
ncbi:TMV resistance protein N-like protein, partial [Tanacetum coccineum]